MAKGEKKEAAAVEAPFRKSLFDPQVIASKDYERFIYTMKFSGKDVKGLSAEGYVHAITPYLENLDSELLQLVKVDRTEKTSAYFYAVVKVTLHLRYASDDRTITGRELVITAMGDGDSREVKDPAALVRNCETRAIKRACARALDLATKDINKILNQPADAVEEDEVGTSLEKEYDPKPRGNDMAAKIKESQKKVLEKLEERKAANVAEAATTENPGGADKDW